MSLFFLLTDLRINIWGEVFVKKEEDLCVEYKYKG